MVLEAAAMTQASSNSIDTMNCRKSQIKEPNSSPNLMSHKARNAVDALIT